MATVNIYLTFDGKCEEAFLFYSRIFRSEIPCWNRFGDETFEGQPPMTEETKKRIMHVSLPISKETMLMGSDTMPGYPHHAGNNFSISINVDSKDEADYFFQKLSEGGKVTMEMQETFWGAYFGMWEDRFGIQWMVNYDDPEKLKDH